MPTKSKVTPAWMMADGSPRPEYVFTPAKPLSQEVKSLTLSQPTVKQLRKAAAVLRYDTEGGIRTTTTDSAIAYGVALIAAVTDVPESVIENLLESDFADLNDFLGSFRRQ